MNAIDQRAREKLHPREMIWPGVGAVVSPRPRSIPWSLKEPMHPSMPLEPATRWASLFDLRWNVPMYGCGAIAGIIAYNNGLKWWASVVLGLVVAQVFGPLKTCRKAAALRKRMVRSQFQLCPICNHNLLGRPRKELCCPECGGFAPRREVVRFWGRYFRLMSQKLVSSPGLRLGRDFVLTEPWRGLDYHVKARRASRDGEAF